MRALIAARISILWMLASFTVMPALYANPALYSLRNAHFEVVGLDRRSVTYVNELSTVAVEVAERYLERERMAFPLPILVSLRPEAHASFEGAYRIRIEARGAVELDIRWEEPMGLETTCRAMGEALLVQYAIFNHGSEGAERVKLWPIDALSQSLFLRLRPSNFALKVDEARGSSLPVLSRVLEPSRAAPEPEARAHGYWLVHALQAYGLDRAIERRLFQQAVAGIDVEDALSSVLGPVEPPADGWAIDSWWSRQMTGLLAREYDVIETMGVSREWLGALARFEAPLIVESESINLNLRSLRLHSQAPQVREWVEARLELLRLRMARINPAYYNAARSLGVLFEAVLNDAPAHEYLHALTFYLSDWEDAKAMQAQIEEKI